MIEGFIFWGGILAAGIIGYAYGYLDGERLVFGSWLKRK